RRARRLKAVAQRDEERRLVEAERGRPLAALGQQLARDPPAEMAERRVEPHRLGVLVARPPRQRRQVVARVDRLGDADEAGRFLELLRERPHRRLAHRSAAARNGPSSMVSRLGGSALAKASRAAARASGGLVASITILVPTRYIGLMPGSIGEALSSVKTRV